MNGRIWFFVLAMRDFLQGRNGIKKIWLLLAVTPSVFAQSLSWPQQGYLAHTTERQFK